MDDIDRYQMLETEMREKRIRMVRETVSSEAGMLGAEYCEDCEAAIPMARRKALPSAIRCVDCQEEYERA